MADRIFRRNFATRAADSGRLRKTLSIPERTYLAYGLVGYEASELTPGVPDPTPAFVRIEQGQIWVEVTMMPGGDQIVARLGQPGAGAGSGWYIALEFGCRVVLELVGGDPQNAVIVSRLADSKCSMPTDVAGVQTGAVAANVPLVGVPAPMWQFMKTPTGQLLAVETGPLGDVLLHAGAGAGIEMKADPPSAIHLNGTTHLGSGFTTPPVGATVGPAGTQLPGVPGVVKVPIPPTPPPPAPPGPAIPYIGTERDGIIRAKDLHQSDVTIDPTFWAFISGVFAHPLIGPVLAAAGIVLPLAATSKASGLGGPGSRHTASD